MNRLTSNGQKINLIVSTVSLISISLAILLNQYRYELFGVVPGNAANNAGFNMLIFLPLSFVGLLLSVISLTLTVVKWKKWRNVKIRIWTFVMALPAIGFFCLLVINMLMILRVH